MSRPALGRSRVQVTLPPDLLARLTSNAAERRMTRSSVIEDCVAEMLREWRVVELSENGRTRVVHEPIRGPQALGQLHLHQFASRSPGGAKLYEVTSEGDRLREELRPARA